VLPSGCRVEADIRLLVAVTRDDIGPVVARILSLFPQASWEELSAPHDMPNWSDPDGEMMLILQNTVVGLGRRRPVPVITLGATDTRLWRCDGVPAYVYGASPQTTTSCTRMCSALSTI
jgi:succinyl-diaminopimelate desuccinylase